MRKMRKKSAIHLCLIGGLILLVTQLGLLALLLYPSDKHKNSPFEDIDAVLNITTCLQLPLLVVDKQLLQQYMNPNQGNAIEKHCILCETNYPLTFVILFRGIKRDISLLSYFQDNNFQAAELRNTKPRIFPNEDIKNIPIGYLLKRNVAIHLVLFHEREGNYWWHGSLYSDPRSSSELSLMGLSTSSLQWMRMEGSLDKFETETVNMDGVPLLIPKDIPRFLRDTASSRFVECNHKMADTFHRIHGKDTSHEALRFNHRAWKLLSRAKTILDKLGVRFWISSGTCLGYYRQCDIIPYSKDVDIGIFITDYSDQIVPQFVAHGFTLKHWFGRVNDSLELSFLSTEIKLDIFFFYEEGQWVWNGGTQAKSGKKFKYLFPRFTLCWTEFLELKVRVPCETQTYIEANYGSDWFTPVTQWDWKSSPPNVRENGVWHTEEWSQVIQVYN